MPMAVTITGVEGTLIYYPMPLFLPESNYIREGEISLMGKRGRYTFCYLVNAMVKVCYHL